MLLLDPSVNQFIEDGSAAGLYGRGRDAGAAPAAAPVSPEASGGIQVAYQGDRLALTLRGGIEMPAVPVRKSPVDGADI